jgi:hypothetical protein
MDLIRPAQVMIIIPMVLCPLLSLIYALMEVMWGWVTIASHYTYHVIAIRYHSSFVFQKRAISRVNNVTLAPAHIIEVKLMNVCHTQTRVPTAKGD